MAAANASPFHQPPIGYRFLPTPDELINFYLFKKLNNQPLPPLCSNAFNYVDIYATHPSIIFDHLNNNGYNEEIVEESDTGIEKRIRYFFTPLKSFVKKDGKNGKRFNRKAGAGSWKEEQSSVIGNGYERYFRYRPSSGQCNDHDGVEWRMHEYSLLDNQELAISRITKLVKKKSGRRNSRTSKIVIRAALVREREVLLNNNVVAGSYNRGGFFNEWMQVTNNNVAESGPSVKQECGGSGSRTPEILIPAALVQEQQVLMNTNVVADDYNGGSFCNALMLGTNNNVAESGPSVKQECGGSGSRTPEILIPAALVQEQQMLMNNNVVADDYNGGSFCNALMLGTNNNVAESGPSVKKESGRSAPRTPEIVTPAALVQEREVLMNNNVVADDYYGGSFCNELMLVTNNNVAESGPSVMNSNPSLLNEEIAGSDVGHESFFNIVSFENDQQPSLDDVMPGGCQKNQIVEVSNNGGFHVFQEFAQGNLF